MIVRVAERALAARSVARAVVATDDTTVLETVRRFGYEAVMTRADHASGTDRLAEAAAGQGQGYDVIVNVQGDEPLISPRTIDLAVAALNADPEAQVATTCEDISDAADVLSPDVVKVVSDAHGRALYFSRAPVPYPRDAARRHGSLAAALREEPELLSLFAKHTGLYVYRRDFLLRYAGWPQGELERAESLEQLRALERGAIIAVVRTDERSIGVDTEEDLERVREIFEAEARGQKAGVRGQ
jgi:3-deoxy-manno-octulosonate cytidylyltransferase (CMP-KDO synthetase)